MSMKSENLAYFSDGHTEVITKFEISKDCHEVWFIVESGRWFVFREEFFKMVVNRDRDDFGAMCDVEYLVTDEIERIRVCVAE